MGVLQKLRIQRFRKLYFRWGWLPVRVSHTQTLLGPGRLKAVKVHLSFLFLFFYLSERTTPSAIDVDDLLLLYPSRTCSFCYGEKGLLMILNKRDVLWYYVGGHFTSTDQVKHLLFFSLCNCSLTLLVASNSMKESGNCAALLSARLKRVFSTRNLTIAQHAFLFSLWAMAANLSCIDSANICIQKYFKRIRCVDEEERCTAPHHT